ncbi:unnamed protein product [Effrenium voratum]|uniref:Protein kinase domain-containing protein n=1 Tax=Effrenium voratum TaxID=2562239 RepID=A0AA36JR63_9DINO|nr:unnamed protein product [Effrenium voratum]CAJ1432635.1 unnamed protein product [Effrenium voratum]
MPVLEAESHGPCSWCCKQIRRARHRFAQQRADEAQVALRSRMQQIQPPKLFVLIAPRNVGEFLSFEETPLGEGGFGTVFRGRPTPAGCKLVPELRPSKSYAVKMVKKTEKGGLTEEIGYSLLSVSPERHLDFMNAMTGRGPFENGIIGFIAAFIQPQFAMYQVMELLEGPDLFDFLANRSARLEEVTARGLVRQMVKALHYMHRTIGALHRDIKPENFGFIKPPTAGQPLPALKLFDMGLAWVLKAPVTEETAKKMLHVKRCGTACYMAPEVWDGHTGPPSDVWSLGVVSFITVSLEVPFKLMEHKQPKLAVRDNELSFESRAWADASDQSKQFLQGLLDKVPSSRLTTGEALAHCWLTASLEPIAEGASPDNGVLPPLTERRLPARSRRSEAGLFESMAMAPESMLAGEVAT